MKLSEMSKLQSMDIDRKRKEYEDKHNDVVAKLKEKHKMEMHTCLNQMTRIESELSLKQQKHEMFI